MSLPFMFRTRYFVPPPLNLPLPLYLDLPLYLYHFSILPVGSPYLRLLSKGILNYALLNSHLFISRATLFNPEGLYSLHTYCAIFKLLGFLHNHRSLASPISR